MREFYRLNFVNAGRGVGTSMAEPRPFNVAWNADESLRFLDIGGNRLYPSRDRLPSGVVLKPLSGTRMQVALPQSLAFSEENGSLVARGAGLNFTATWISKQGLSPDSFTGPHTVSEVGSGFVETINGQAFSEKSWRLTDQQRLLVVLSEMNGGTLVLRLVTPEKQASLFVRTVMGMVLAHSVW